MNCSYNNGIETCFGSCILSEMPPDATAAQQLFAQRMRAAGRQALMYFHAFISTETNATQKYEECEITDRNNRQVYYACPGTPNQNYPLFLADGTNAYSAALDKVIERAFTLGFSGIFHDEASSSASSYTSSRWDGFSVLLDADTKAVTTKLGSVPLIRLQHKVRMLEAIRKHNGVLLLNGAPVTRTFREAAMRAGRGRVLAEVEAEQESFAFQTHLFTPVSMRLSECAAHATSVCIRALLLIIVGAFCFSQMMLNRLPGPSYATDLDVRYNATCTACAAPASEGAHCFERSISDHLQNGVLTFVYSTMWKNGSAETINHRLFPFDVAKIGAGVVSGPRKLVTKNSGTHILPVTNSSEELEVSVYHFGTLVRRVRPSDGSDKVRLALVSDEIAIVEVVPKLM
jgi:hypothetical protein